MTLCGVQYVDPVSLLCAKCGSCLPVVCNMLILSPCGVQNVDPVSLWCAKCGSLCGVQFHIYFSPLHYMKILVNGTSPVTGFFSPRILAFQDLGVPSGSILKILHSGHSEYLGLCMFLNKEWLFAYTLRHYWFLGAFAKLRKATIASLHLFVSLSTWNNATPTARMFIKFDTRVFYENLSTIFKFHWIPTRITGTLHLDLRTFMVISRWILLRMRTFQAKFVEKIETRNFFFFHETSSKNRSVYEVMCNKQSV